MLVIVEATGRGSYQRTVARVRRPAPTQKLVSIFEMAILSIALMVAHEAVEGSRVASLVTEIGLRV